VKGARNEGGRKTNCANHRHLRLWSKPLSSEQTQTGAAIMAAIGAPGFDFSEKIEIGFDGLVSLKTAAAVFFRKKAKKFYSRNSCRCLPFTSRARLKFATRHAICRSITLKSTPIIEVTPQEPPMKILKSQDSQVYKAIAGEIKRQVEKLELIASRKLCFPSVLERKAQS